MQAQVAPPPVRRRSHAFGQKGTSLVYHQPDQSPSEASPVGDHAVQSQLCSRAAAPGTLGTLVVVVPASSRDSMNPLTQFSLEVVLPPGGPLGKSITVRFCDVCCRWGELRSTHLCGATWFKHLGQLLAAIAGGGAR